MRFAIEGGMIEECGMSRSLEGEQEWPPSRVKIKRLKVTFEEAQGEPVAIIFPDPPSMVGQSGE